VVLGVLAHYNAGLITQHQKAHTVPVNQVIASLCNDPVAGPGPYLTALTLTADAL